METNANVNVTVEKKKHRRTPTKNFIGPKEREENMRAAIIDTNVSIRENIERRFGNYFYYG